MSQKRYIKRGDNRPPLTEVKCCGQWLLCQGFTNGCPNCGTEYSFSGAALQKNWRKGEAGDYLNEG